MEGGGGEGREREGGGVTLCWRLRLHIIINPAQFACDRLEPRNPARCDSEACSLAVRLKC